MAWKLSHQSVRAGGFLFAGKKPQFSGSAKERISKSPAGGDCRPGQPEADSVIQAFLFFGGGGL